MVNDQVKTNIRGAIDSITWSISIDEVEPWTEIVKNLKLVPCLGSLSQEAHENLAIADMNRSKSNSGEGWRSKRFQKKIMVTLEIVL
jgi:glutamate synthase domain-containing protein 2